MRCHSCGTPVREGQKFCMECGASLRGIADTTGEVPVVPGRGRTTAEEPTRPHARPVGADDVDSAFARPTGPPAARPGSLDEPTRPVPGALGDPDQTAPLARQPRQDQAVTCELLVVEATGATVDPDATTVGAEQRASPWPPSTTAPMPEATADPASGRRGFRLRPLLLLTFVAAAATVAGVLMEVVRVDPALDGGAPGFGVNDFGTNNLVAACLAAGAMVLGGVVWCAGHPWGAGLAGGAGASLAGWVAMVVGVAEWRLADGATAGSVVERATGFWVLVGAGGAGLLVLIASLARSGRYRRAGLDPWVAALAAVSFLIAAGGPLIPEGATADWTGNWSSDTLTADLPTAFFAGRAVQLGLVAVCGVIGCLLVRRWGLGLAVGAAVSSGWLIATAATDRTDSPIGPAYANPGYVSLEPHAVTVVGFSLVGFFCLVAVVMALLDAGR